MHNLSWSIIKYLITLSTYPRKGFNLAKAAKYIKFFKLLKHT